MISNRRKNYFIKKKFQADFFIKFAVLLLLEAVIIGFLFVHISRGTLTTSYNDLGLVIEKTSAFLLTNFVAITLASGIGIAIAGIFVFMFISHRIGGPLYKIEKTLGEIASGDVSHKMVFRSTDELEEIGAGVNGIIEEFDNSLCRIKKNVSELRDISEKLQSKELNDRLDTLSDELNRFKTSKK